MQRTPEALGAELAALDAAGLRREVRIAPDTAIDFSSNDYLGLTKHPQLIDAVAAAARRYGAGSGAAHLVTGHGPEHAALEAELAAFVGRERALLFSTGYMANLGVVTSLVGRGDTLLADKLNHASLNDAALLSRADLRRYTHRDHQAVATLLGSVAARKDRAASAIVTDGVFSMDGDVAPLPELAASARTHRAWLVVDDAHGLGVLGATGRGACEQFGLGQNDVPALVGTLGKAFGSFGAFVAGERDLIDCLINKARTYIYTTALPQPVAAASRAALKLVDRESWRREKLMHNIALFRGACARERIPLVESSTPIQPVLLGSASRALAASEALLAHGFIVKAIRPPTVPQGSARLRVALSARHDAADIVKLVELLAEATQP